MLSDEAWARILADVRRRRFVLVIPHDEHAQPRQEPRSKRPPEPRWRGLRRMGDSVLARALEQHAATQTQWGL